MCAAKWVHSPEIGLCNAAKYVSSRQRSLHAAHQTWEKTLGALKRGARAAIDDGKPYPYTTLFGQAARNGGRNRKHAADNPPPPAPPVPPVSSAA
jgi:hypothetical protein